MELLWICCCVLLYMEFLTILTIFDLIYDDLGKCTVIYHCGNMWPCENEHGERAWIHSRRSLKIWGGKIEKIWRRPAGKWNPVTRVLSGKPGAEKQQLPAVRKFSEYSFQWPVFEHVSLITTHHSWQRCIWSQLQCMLKSIIAYFSYPKHCSKWSGHCCRFQLH